MLVQIGKKKPKKPCLFKPCLVTFKASAVGIGNLTEVEADQSDHCMKFDVYFFQRDFTLNDTIESVSV